MEEAESCIERVGAWEGSWPGARKCKELLSDLTTTARAAVANGTAAARREQRSLSTARSSARSRSSTASPLSSPATAASHAGRPIKGKPSRTRTPSNRRKSRDSNPSPRQAHETINSPTYSPTSAVHPAHKRSHGEMDHMPSFGTNAVSLQNAFPRYTNNQTNNGTFRDPSSSTLVASQYLSGIKTSASPNLMPSNIYDSPVPSSATPQTPATMSYGYGYNSNSGAPETTWESAQENANADMFTPNSDAVYYQQNSQGNLDSNFVSYDSGMGMQTQPEGTPPSSSFATPGLPFPGLDFIRNYTPGVYVEDGQEALWRSFDAGEFRYDPDLPFTLGELPPDGSGRS